LNINIAQINNQNIVHYLREQLSKTCHIPLKSLK